MNNYDRFIAAAKAGNVLPSAGEKLNLLLEKRAAATISIVYSDLIKTFNDIVIQLDSLDKMNLLSDEATYVFSKKLEYFHNAIRSASDDMGAILSILGKLSAFTTEISTYIDRD